MVKNHLGGLVNAIYLGITNARAEGNSRIQRIKYTGRGFRPGRFHRAIFFQLGDLNMAPETLEPIAPRNLMKSQLHKHGK